MTGALVLAACGPAASLADKVGLPAPADLLSRAELTPVNREATRLPEKGRTIVRLDEREEPGAVWVQAAELADGIIELEVRGEDRAGASFVGVAFHGVDDTRYDAVYLRPFHFRSENPVARSRMLQYVSHPYHPWRSLRAAHPGVYEAEIVPAPNPSDWVRLRVELRYPTVRVFVDDATEPALIVPQLSDQRRGRVGLWVGNGSRGDYAALRLIPHEP